MATLGALWSQQMAFTVTTTAGTVYTHALGYTPTVIILTVNNTCTPVQTVAYTAAGTNLITVVSSGTAVLNVDVTVGSFHSLIK